MNFCPGNFFGTGGGEQDRLPAEFRQMADKAAHSVAAHVAERREEIRDDQDALHSTTNSVVSGAFASNEISHTSIGRRWLYDGENQPSATRSWPGALRRKLPKINSP